MSLPRIILATTSASRQEAFKLADIPFSAEPSQVDENIQNRPENPVELVAFLARKKAEAVYQHHNRDPCVIIGFDSVGYIPNRRLILEKPNSREEAFSRLQMLSGDCLPHSFYTGIYVIKSSSNKNPKITGNVINTLISFRPNISDVEINSYLNQGEHYRKLALGYDPIKGYSSTFVASVEGSPSNVAYGVPMSEVINLIGRLKD